MTQFHPQLPLVGLEGCKIGWQLYHIKSLVVKCLNQCTLLLSLLLSTLGRVGAEKKRLNVTLM